MACEFCADDEDRLSDDISQSDLMGLVDAIMGHEVGEAMLRLEIIFRDDSKAREWIAIARSRAMRKAA